MNVQIPVCFKSIGKKLGKRMSPGLCRVWFPEEHPRVFDKIYFFLIHILQDDWRKHIEIFKINIKLIENDSVIAFASFICVYTTVFLTFAQENVCNLHCALKGAFYWRSLRFSDSFVKCDTTCAIRRS